MALVSLLCRQEIFTQVIFTKIRNMDRAEKSLSAGMSMQVSGSRAEVPARAFTNLQMADGTRARYGTVSLTALGS
jgi:hypothetical protein